MFKNATLLRLVRSAPMSMGEAFDKAQEAQFVPTQPTQAKSVGWVRPRDEANAPFIEFIAGHWIMAAMIETRTVPASAVDKRVNELADKIEQETGRKPGKKQRKELKEAVVLELLPRAFPKQARVLVWIDPASNIITLDTASASVTDDVTSLLAQTLPHGIAPLSTQQSPASVMTGWLRMGESHVDEFALGEACELHATDASEATVAYTNTMLDSPEIKAHVQHGKLATNLALVWNDRAWFTLTEGLVLKHLEVMGNAADIATPPADVDSHFDADAAIFTGEMAPLLSDLIDALGGLLEEPSEEAAA